MFTQLAKRFPKNYISCAKEFYMKEEEMNALMRMDKNIGPWISITGVKNREDNLLCWYILLYVAKHFENDIFNYSRFDVDEFCHEFSYIRGNLVRKYKGETLQELDMDHGQYLLLREIQDKKQKRKAGEYEAGEFLWDSVIENALYSLANRPICISGKTGGSYLDPDFKQIKETGGVLVFSRLMAAIGSRGKVVYYYSLNPYFEKNLSSYFVNLNIDSLCAMRRRGLEGLYVYLISVRTGIYLSGKWESTVDYTPPFEKLCEVIGVREKTAEGKLYSFKRRKQLVTQALNFVNSESHDMKFTVKWVSRNANDASASVPLFIFSEEGFRQHKKMSLYIRWKIFGEELQRRYFNRLTSLSESPVDAVDFGAWMLDMKDDWSYKQSCFETVYGDTFNKTNCRDEIEQRYREFNGFIKKGYSIAQIYPGLYPGYEKVKEKEEKIL